MTMEIYFEGSNQLKITQMFEFTVMNNKIHARPVDLENKIFEPEFTIKFKEGKGAVEGTVKSEVESRWPGEGIPYPKKRNIPNSQAGENTTSGGRLAVQTRQHGNEKQTVGSAAIREPTDLQTRQPIMRTLQFQTQNGSPDAPVESQKSQIADKSRPPQQNERVAPFSGKRGGRERDPVLPPSMVGQTVKKLPDPRLHENTQKQQPIIEPTTGPFLKQATRGRDPQPSSSKGLTETPKVQERGEKPIHKPTSSKNQSGPSSEIQPPSSPRELNNDILELPSPCDYAIEEWLLGKIQHGRENLRNFSAVHEQLCVKGNDRVVGSSSKQDRLH